MLLTYSLSPWSPLITLQPVSINNVFPLHLKTCLLIPFHHECNLLQCVSIIGVTFPKHLVAYHACLFHVTMVAILITLQKVSIIGVTLPGGLTCLFIVTDHGNNAGSKYQ